MDEMEFAVYARKVFSRWADKMMEIAAQAITGDINEDNPYNPDMDNPLEKDLFISMMNIMRRAAESVSAYHNGLRESRYVIEDLALVLDELYSNNGFVKECASVVRRVHDSMPKVMETPFGTVFTVDRSQLPPTLRQLLDLLKDGDRDAEKKDNKD